MSDLTRGEDYLLNNRTAMDSAVVAMMMAAVASINKCGPIPPDPVRAAALVINEASEVLSEALKLTNPTGAASHRSAKGTPEAMYAELAQVGGLALLIMTKLTKPESKQEPK